MSYDCLTEATPLTAAEPGLPKKLVSFYSPSPSPWPTLLPLLAPPFPSSTTHVVPKPSGLPLPVSAFSQVFHFLIAGVFAPFQPVLSPCQPRAPDAQSRGSTP